MNGPEHYREAGRLSNASAAAMLAAFTEGGAVHEGHLRVAEVYAVRALVHATAANAAATALGLSDGGTVAGMRLGDAEAWERAASVVPVDEEHDDATACDEHLTAPGECCPHCPAWTA